MRAHDQERAAAIDRPTSRLAAKRAAVPPPFERVIEELGPQLLRFCSAQVGVQRAQDVFQETMLAALRAYNDVRDPAAIRSWLFSIAAHKAIDSHRARARAPEPVADLPEPARRTAEDIAPVDEALWQRVGALPDKQRQAVALRFLGDLSHREIAEVMQVSEAAARRNVFEALERLRSSSSTASSPPTAKGSAPR